MKNATKAKIVLIIVMLCLAGSLVATILGIVLIFTEKNTSYLLITIFGIFLGKLLCRIYSYALATAIMTIPELKKYNRVSEKGYQMAEEAKNLIKKVDKNIKIADFNVYQLEKMEASLYYYNEDTQERNICISIEKWSRKGKDVCFFAFLYFVLCSQHNSDIFKKSFQIGLNQLLTEWIIGNYSEKYEVPYIGENEERRMVWEILEASPQVDMKEIFLHYIDFQSEFFKYIVPSQYFR